jgi:Zn-dependent protease
MLGPVQPTPYDLRFQIAGIPVNVTPMFWVVSALLGLRGVEYYGAPGLFVWVVAVFGSILLHELGHAIAFRYYGYQPHVILYQFGGIAQSYGRSRYQNWTEDLVISLAGPGIQLLFYGVIWLFSWQLLARGIYPAPGSPASLLLADLRWINLGWALINLLPVLPLDGGRVAETLLIRFRRFDGAEWALQLSIATAIAAALFFAVSPYTKGSFAWILFAVLAFSNFQNLQGRYRGW